MIPKMKMFMILPY